MEQILQDYAFGVQIRIASSAVPQSSASSVTLTTTLSRENACLVATNFVLPALSRGTFVNLVGIPKAMATTD
jgi:hypothetical protein